MITSFKVSKFFDLDVEDHGIIYNCMRSILMPHISELQYLAEKMVS